CEAAAVVRDMVPMQAERSDTAFGTGTPVGRVPGAALARRAIDALRAVPASRWDRVALAAIVAGIAIRIAWGLAIHPPFDYIYSDMNGYVSRAMRLATGTPAWRGDAFYPPGTHLLLSVPFRLFGTGSPGLWAAAVLWCALSGLT